MKYSTRNMTRIAGGLIVAGLLAAGQAGAADTSISSQGADFIKDAAAGNQAEIATAQIAQEKSQNPEVKNLAQMIQQDHQQAQEKLQTIAQNHGVTLPEKSSWMERREQSKLNKLSGADFDQQYAKDVVEDHAKDIKSFQKASQDVPDADVKEYAQTCLATLRQHLQHAKAAAKAVGVDDATISSLTKGLPEAVGGTGQNQESGQGMGHNMGHQPY